jgi:hypothetical protein
MAWIATLLILLAVADPAGAQESDVGSPPTDYLTWTRAQAERIGRSARVNGRVWGDQDLIHSERALSYKLRATWLTADVIRATARLAQLSESLSDEQTNALVREAEAAGDTVVLVEIDPDEGSGVVPLDWVALLGPRGARAGEAGVVKGTIVPGLRDVRALAGTFRRDYAYDLFWVVFPLKSETGQALFPESVTEAELVVRIYTREGHVRWPIPQSVRNRP